MFGRRRVRDQGPYLSEVEIADIIYRPSFTFMVRVHGCPFVVVVGIEHGAVRLADRC